MLNKQLKSPPHQPPSVVVQRSQITHATAGTSAAYGFSQNTGVQSQNLSSARHSATSGANSGPTRSNERSTGSASEIDQTQVASGTPNQPGQPAQFLAGYNSAASNNYYYSQHSIINDFTMMPGGANYQSNKIAKKTALNQNAAAAMQAYTVQQQPIKAASSHIQPRKNAHSNDQLSTLSPQHHSSYAGHIYQATAKKPMTGTLQQNYASASNNGINRYESLQSKLKNKRRLQPSTNLIGSNSQLIGAVQNSAVTGKQIAHSGEPLKFNQTQKIVTSAFGIGGSISGAHSTIGGGNSTANKKQLKLSIDQHSDSSFNNVSIKSADKYNSVVRVANGLVTGKHIGMGGSLNTKDLSNQISPSSNNGGGSIIQNLTSSQNSVYSSHFSNNSRFTNTRPKNPTDSSSLSSKNSDSLSGTGALNILHDFKKTVGQKPATKGKFDLSQIMAVATVQGGRDQDQILIQQHHKSDSMSDTGEGSFSSNHEQQQQQKPKVTTVAKPHGMQEYVPQNQMKASNSISNLAKISSQASIATMSQIQAQNVAQPSSYKSKFTLVNRQKETVKDSKRISQPTSTTGADSYRRNSDVHQQQRVSTQGKVANNCGAPFSPKAQASQGIIKAPASKYMSQAQHQQIAQNLTVSGQNQRNVGGLNLKSTGSVESRGTIGSVGSTNGAKKSGRETQKNPEMTLQSQAVQSSYWNYEATQNYVKPPAQKNLESPNAQAATKLNLDQLQNIIKAQQSQHKAMASETIHEERCEDSEQNTKRESTANNIVPKQSSTNLHGDTSVPQTMSQKSKSLLTINFDSTENLKRHEQMVVSPKNNPATTEKAAAPPNLGIQGPSRVEEIKSNPTLQALKEQLKSQIAKQHHQFSNPNQPSSQIEADDIQYPITPQKALKLFSNNLTEYERQEILEYNEIYFLGLNAPKIKGQAQLPHNLGYDDDRGDYQVVLKDHIAYRYEVLEPIGKGSFGQAIKCYDYKNNELIALKIIRNKKRFHHQAGVELNILNYLKEHDPDDVNNIIRIKDYSVFRKHLVISFELLSINLYEFIKNNSFQGISLGLIRRFAIQILQALKYQRDHGIIHCDLKPENILLKQPNKSGIKIIDYGSSCFQNQRIYTYIQSRFYRAPEIVLGIPYTTSIDMWSFGCILAELYSGFPLFPGENEMQQLAYIMEIKGVPEDYLLELSSRRKLFFDAENQPIIVADSRGKKRRPLTKTFKSVLKCQDPNFLSFLDNCLDWDPVNRMTPLEALQHEWILEGLPPKVLLHHQRMFGNRDDKQNIKDATLTAIQGFPANAESNSIFQQLKSKREAAKTQREEVKREQQVNETDSALSPEFENAIQATENVERTPQIVFSQISQASQNSLQGQPKKNRTIQHLVQELLEEKASEKVPSKHDSKKDSENKISVTIVDPQTFYNQPQKLAPLQAFKNSAVQRIQVKEVYHQASSIQQDVPDEDMEEGIHFNKTQRIPISLIKQQEKLPVHQVPFYNPKVSGPKLNNYVTQAAAFSKKTHSSTSNLVNRGQPNHSATLAQQTISNSSFNNHQNVCSVSNFNIQPAPYNDMPQASSRSSKGNTVQMQNKQRGGGQPIKIDLSNSLSEHQLDVPKSSRR